MISILIIDHLYKRHISDMCFLVAIVVVVSTVILQNASRSALKVL